MKTEQRFGLALFFALCFTCILPSAHSQEVLGTPVGIAQGSPGALWPKGMSVEALNPQNLYPNGPQFGLSNTSGGFGTTGTGSISAVGIAQRSVSPLVQQEMQAPNIFINRLTILENAQRNRTQTLLSGVLNANFRAEMSRSSSDLVFQNNQPLLQPYALPGVDAVLQDRPSNSDSILRTGL